MEDSQEEVDNAEVGQLSREQQTFYRLEITSREAMGDYYQKWL
jgi:hypothetical protein